MENSISARDLKAGDRIKVGATKFTTVLHIEYCNGNNGEAPRLYGAISSTTSTATGLKILLEDADALYVHPAQSFSIRRG